MMFQIIRGGKRKKRSNTNQTAKKGEREGGRNGKRKKTTRRQ